MIPVSEHETLRPQLNELRKDLSALSGTYGDLEQKVESLLTQYDDYVSNHHRTALVSSI